MTEGESVKWVKVADLSGLKTYRDTQLLVERAVDAFEELKRERTHRG
jgi:hypothetical protein